ncbi:hypothetical protein [Dehalobacter restrictus]|uniref:hypothetical protein n=1 Tax=Dehalobacter restrictus TaxID=55583 RepID=UPI00338F8262
MKSYIKPSLEFVTLRPEEMFAGTGSFVAPETTPPPVIIKPGEGGTLITLP